MTKKTLTSLLAIGLLNLISLTPAVAEIVYTNIQSSKDTIDLKSIERKSKNTDQKSSQKKILKGYDGGMLLHTGYLKGTISPINYQAKGTTFGIGGLVHLHLGNHFRLGTEGYVSIMNQMHNHSFIKIGWGGILGDFYWDCGRVIPYIGLTIGGGSVTEMLMFEGDHTDWEPEKETYFHKEPFLAIDPFVGLQIKLTQVIHINIKVDCLNAIGSKNLFHPIGPRLYFGFVFNH